MTDTFKQRNFALGTLFLVGAALARVGIRTEEAETFRVFASKFN